MSAQFRVQVFVTYRSDQSLTKEFARLLKEMISFMGVRNARKPKLRQSRSKAPDVFSARATRGSWLREAYLTWLEDSAMYG